MKREFVGVLTACVLFPLAAGGCTKAFDGNDPNNISPFAMRAASPEDVERRRKSEEAASKAIPVKVVEVKAERDGSNWHYFVRLEATNLSSRKINQFTVRFEMLDATSKHIFGSEGRDVKLSDPLKPGEKGQGLLDQVLNQDEHDRFAHVTVSCTSYWAAI